MSKYEKLVSPVGEALWAHVHKPKPAFKDERGTVKGEPKFQIELILDPAKDPAAKAWTDALRAQLQAIPTQKDKDGKDKPKQSPIRRELDEQDQPTGRLIALFRTSEKFPPGVFDRYGRKLPATALVGNGSKVKVGYSPNTYKEFGGGINFYLNAVQVLELVEYKGQTAESAGFEVEPLPADAPPLPSEQPAAEAGDANEDNIPF